EDHPIKHNHSHMKRHRLYAERALGKRLLGKHPVHHHYNGDGTSNLVICEDNAYHRFLHKRLKEFRATGKVTSEYIKVKKDMVYVGKKWWLRSEFYQKYLCKKSGLKSET
ncbi:MAG: hypothetical protein KJ556_20800, partial [Gammaproteobacteria bacterium]|nr:hypothetical protein [Gammaproteobacteria bacterium]